MSRGSLVGVAASCLFLGASAQADPPSRAIDPPPGALDYVEKLAPKQWMFGRLLWQGLEPCTRDRCEATNNALRCPSWWPRRKRTAETPAKRTKKRARCRVVPHGAITW